MGLSRGNSATNTPALARAQPSNSHLNNLGKTAPTSNGIISPHAGHDKIHSASTSTPSSPAGSLGSGADGKELKFFENVSAGLNNIPQSPDKIVAKDVKSDKNPMSRLTRMFSQSGKDKKDKEKELERKRLQQQHSQGGHVEHIHSGATSPMPRHSEKDGEYSSDTDGPQSRGSSVAGDHPKSRNVSGNHKNGDATQHFVRFEMLEDGVNHVHHLRAAKRQEKL